MAGNMTPATGPLAASVINVHCITKKNATDLLSLNDCRTRALAGHAFINKFTKISYGNVRGRQIPYATTLLIEVINVTGSGAAGHVVRPGLSCVKMKVCAIDIPAKSTDMVSLTGQSRDKVEAWRYRLHDCSHYQLVPVPSNNCRMHYYFAAATQFEHIEVGLFYGKDNIVKITFSGTDGTGRRVTTVIFNKHVDHGASGGKMLVTTAYLN